MDAAELDRTVDEFEAARRAKEHFPRAWFDRLSLDDAYRIQLALVRRHCEATSQRRVGWKVGLTAKAIQEQFGFDEPVFGCLLEQGKIASGHAFRHADLIGPGFENELCVHLARDIAPGASFAEVVAAVGAVHPALEIIETRGDLSKQMALALTDNAQQHSFVIGAPSSDLDPDLLTSMVATVKVNGAEVGGGQGSAVLGHPYNSVAWLAGKLAAFGERLRAGDFVMSGSFTRQFPLARGDRVETSFSGLGMASASFE